MDHHSFDDFPPNELSRSLRSEARQGSEAILSRLFHADTLDDAIVALSDVVAAISVHVHERSGPCTDTAPLCALIVN